MALGARRGPTSTRPVLRRASTPLEGSPKPQGSREAAGAFRRLGYRIGLTEEKGLLPRGNDAPVEPQAGRLRLGPRFLPHVLSGLGPEKR